MGPGPRVQWVRYGNTVSSGSKTSQYFITPAARGDGGVNPKTGDYTPFILPRGSARPRLRRQFPVGAQAISDAGGAGTLGLLRHHRGDLLEVLSFALENEGKLEHPVECPSRRWTTRRPSRRTGSGPLRFHRRGRRPEVKFEDAVLRLEITPHVIDGATAEDEDHREEGRGRPDSDRMDGNPFIIKKQTDTTLIVKNGDTIVISASREERGPPTRVGGSLAS